MTSEFKENGNFATIPSYEELIEPFKELAKSTKESKGLKLTSSQDQVAKRFEHENWQKLTYWIKGIRETLKTVNLSNAEWGFIYDISNGWLVRIEQGKSDLLIGVIDGDRYNSLSGKWFGELSKINNHGESWEPSEPMRKFVDKIHGYTEEQSKAIILKVYVFGIELFSIRNLTHSHHSLVVVGDTSFT